MNLPHDRQIAEWLAAGSSEGPPESLARALAATRRTRKRPRWTFPERWLPVQLTMSRTPSWRPLFTIVSLALLIVGLVATALYIGSQRSLPPLQFRNGAVVFEQDGDLFIADQLGGTPRALTAGPDADEIPVFSRQGDRIAFKRDGQDGVRVMTVSPDGSDLREVWNSVGEFGIWGLEWSPDGSALIVSGISPDQETAHVVRTDASGSTRLDFGPDLFDFRPSWRPDGRHIALHGEQGLGTSDPGNATPDRGLWLADADGTNLRQLVGPVARLGSHEWSPGGQHISFVSDGPGNIDQVSIADIDAGGGLTALRQLRLDPESTNETRPKWSPDGSQLAVIVSKGALEQIGVVKPDGSDFRIVWPDVTDLGSSFEYFWSPDGQSLVITEVTSEEDPDSGLIGRRAERSWILDVATGERTEVGTPVSTWQRLAP
jgi:TolB protein